MEHKHGVIYILTNPSFPDFVKIGYADDIQTRLKQLNRSECIPCLCDIRRQLPLVRPEDTFYHRQAESEPSLN